MLLVLSRSTCRMPRKRLRAPVFHFRLDKNKLKEAELRDGHYLLRSNHTGGDPAGAVGARACN